MLQLWRFSPQFRDFRATLGFSALLRTFRLFSWATLLVLPFFAPPVSSPLLSHLQGLALCVFAAALHLCWSGCGFRVRLSAPSCLASHFSTFSYASLICVLPMFVSSLRFGSGLCRSWILGRFTCGGVWVGILMLYPTGVPYICVWGFFYDGGVVSPLLLLGVSGRLFLILFWCACSAISLGHLRFSAVSCGWRPFWGSAPR